MQGIYLLQGVIKHYDWGGTTYIPSLLNKENPVHEPFAEYWLGTHSSGIATVLTTDGETKPLTAYINDLPFLFKILDVKQMLSIQVHPTKKAAEQGYKKENEAGIALNDSQRNFKDDNHKPELMVALSDFWLLHGFRPKDEMMKVLTSEIHFNELIPVFEKKGYDGLYRHVMEIPQEDVNRILHHVVNHRPALHTGNEPDKTDSYYWMSKAGQLSTGENIDRGIFSIFFFNIVHLKKGEGIFQGPGVPHAYLEGQNAEIMANSDNVLRGGLTTKHIDVQELLKHIICAPTIPKIIRGKAVTKEERNYPVPVSDFYLSLIDIDKNKISTLNPHGAEILFVNEGSLTLSRGTYSIELRPGNPAALLIPGEPIILNTHEKSTIFRAGIPLIVR